MASEFRGRLIKRGEQDVALVHEIQAALLGKGYGPFNVGAFDSQMTSVVKLYQSQHSDSRGRPLSIDGEIGLYTWGSLFPQPIPVPSSVSSTLMLHALGIAGTQVGQMEEPLGNNTGPMVNEYLLSVGIDPTVGTPADRFWCMAFVYWCFNTAAKSLGTPNPLPQTGGCSRHWRKSQNVPKAQRILAATAYSNLSLVKPGLVFILDFGGGHGHTGIVERLGAGGELLTIEGNTDAQGSGNGVGVFRSARRQLNDKTLVGFVDYSLC